MSEERKVPDGYSFWWEPMAQRLEEMPDGLSGPDKILYIQLRGLYGQVKQKIINRDTAVLEKKKLLEEHRCYQFQEEMGQEWIAVIQKTELARSAFRKNPTVENAWKLIDAIEGR